MKQLTFDEKDIKKLLKLDTPTSRGLLFVKRLLKTLISLSVIFFIAFFLLNGTAELKRVKYTENTVVAPIPKVIAPEVHYLPRLIATKISLDAPAIYGVSNATFMTNLENGVVQYPGTALPGQLGNLVILGHSSNYPWAPGNYKTVFTLLDKLAVGDEITVPYDTHKFVYKVTGISIIKPTELSVLNRSADARLTLITCYPVGTTRSRLVITAALVDDPVGTQTTEPDTTSAIPSPR